MANFKGTVFESTRLYTLREFGEDGVARVLGELSPDDQRVLTELHAIGWCPVEPVSFESTLQPGIHVIGDAAIMGGMPKSAFAANAQAKVCAAAIVELLAGRKPVDPLLINTCYSLVAPDYGISIAGVYRPDKGVLADVPGAGGVSPLEVVGGFRAQEALFADSWFKTITAETFG